MKRKQQGFINSQLAVGVLVMGAMAATYATVARNDSLDKLAYNTGKEAGQVNNAIRAYISRNATNDELIPDGDTHYNHVRWLKSQSQCGGSATADMAYLPCNFPETLPLGLNYDIVLNKNASTGNISSEIRLGIPNDSVENIPYLSGQVVSGAKGVGTLNADPDFGGMVYFDARDDDDGYVTLIAENTAESDMYLRADGSVMPTADFNWNGRNIHNIAQLSAGDIHSAGEITADGDIKTKQSIAADGSITADGTVTTDMLILSSNNNAAGSFCDAERALSMDSTDKLLVCRIDPTGSNYSAPSK